MGTKVQIQTIILTEKFKPIFEMFLLEVGKDKDFLEILKKKKTMSNIQDRRFVANKNNKLMSIKIRYAIQYYLSNKVKKDITEEVEEDEDDTKSPEVQNE